jgi:hypothetical protein
VKLRSGNAASVLVEFPSGAPDGNLTWSLLGPDGLPVTGGTIVVPSNAVSQVINVPAQYNTTDVGELSSYRDLVWSYSVAGAIINGEQRYTLEARVPFGASQDGVRTKLGVERHDLPDSEISLVQGFYDFAAAVGGPEFTELATTPGESLRIRNAIEAMAALALIPSMQVRIASKESSGTDTFQRQDIDWAMLATDLQAQVNTGITVILPNLDLTAGFGAIFILAGPSTDAVTGEGAQG